MTGESKTTQNHEKIHAWAMDRDAIPSIVRETGGDGGILRFDFPGYKGEETLEEISWDEFFEIFDERNLTFLYQEKTHDGEMSHFNKFIRTNDS